MFSDARVSGYLFAILFNALTSLLIFRLSVLSKGAPLTRSQRWGMKVAGSLYLLNSLQVTGMMLVVIGDGVVPSGLLVVWNRSASCFNFITLLPLLLFGLVYPRPALRWGHLRVVVIGLCALWIPLTLLDLIIFRPMEVWVLGSSQALVQFTYLFSMFVPLFLWLPWYRRQQSPQVNMIMTLLIWGYLLNPAIGLQDILYDQWVINPEAPVSSIAILQEILTLFVFIYLFKIIFERRGHWSGADWTNVIMTSIVVLSIIILTVMTPTINSNEAAYVYAQPGIGLLWFLLTTGTWTIIRPLLFTYGLLRYQFFGQNVRATETFAMVLGLLASGLVFCVALVALSGAGAWVALGLAIVLAGAGLYPLYRLSGNLVDRLLPMSSGAKVPLAERRATYFMGLQTAVAEGAMDDREDQSTLKRLRLDLDVSQREHDILMDGFARERPQVEGKGLEAVYLFHRTGRMLGYVARKRSDQEAAGQMAALFTTVSNFLADTIKRGGGHVDSIEYGNVTLIAEVEGDVALGVILSGKDNPQVRQRMRDVLRRIRKEYQDVLYTGQAPPEAVSRLKERSRGIESLLREFLSEGG